MEKFTLVVGNKNYSSWSLRPWLVLTHFKVPFKEVLIPLARPDSKVKILKYSPSGKVPLLKHGKSTVWESIAICDYVADLFPKKNMWPKEYAKRAYARSIASEMHAAFFNLRKACPMNVRARITVELTPEVTKDISRMTAIWEDARKKHGQSGDFLFGDFTIADAMFAPVIFRFRTYGIAVSGPVKKYMDSMLNLPAVKKWEEAALKETWVIERH